MGSNRRIRSETGVTASESMGVLLLVALVVAALVASPIGQQIRDGITCAVTEILGGDCTQVGREPGLKSCIQTQEERAAEAHVKIVVFTVGGGVKGTREERADGSVKLTLEADADAGLEFATPSGEVDVGGEGGPQGTGQREVSVTAGGKVARSWTFDGEDPAANQAAANEFVGDVEDKVKAHADLNPFNSGPDLPDHDETSVQGGVNADARAELRSGSGLKGNLGGAVGATFNDRNGEKEIFFEVNAGAGANAAAADFFRFGGAGRGQVRMGLVYDREGRPTEMKVYGRADGSLTAGAQLEGGELDEALSEVSDETQVSAGGRVALNATLDLTDPANLSAANAFIDGVNPATGAPVAAGTAAADLFRRFRDDGRVSVQTYRTATSTAGGEVDLTAFGAGFEYTETDADLLRAWYLDEEGFTPWTGCAGGGTL